jgi:hypothetical protein
MRSKVFSEDKVPWSAWRDKLPDSSVNYEPHFMLTQEPPGNLLQLVTIFILYRFSSTITTITIKSC